MGEEEMELFEYIQRVAEAKANQDKSALAKVIVEGKHKYVSMADAAVSLFELTNTIVDAVEVGVETLQALTEARMVAIVECLDEETADRVRQLFKENEDNLFEQENTTNNTSEDDE